MKIIEVETADGVELFGIQYGEKFKDTCVIITNGTCGNVFENKFLRVLGEELEKRKISFVYAHNRGAFHRIDTKTASGNPIGATYEMFDDCIFDLQAWVDWAKKMGYKHIVLGGHSYGANKVVFYLSKHPECGVEKYILISPTDVGRLKESEERSAQRLLPLARDYQKTGRQNELLPEAFDDYNLFTAAAFLDFSCNPHSRNLPVYGNGSWQQLKSIHLSGLFVMGEKDGFAFGNAQRHLQTIDANSGTGNNMVRVVKNAGHTFRGQEGELAGAVLHFVEED